VNELVKKGIKNWKKIKLTNIRYYYELILEESKRFRNSSSQRGIKKYRINIFKLNRMKKLLKLRNKLHIGCGDVRIDNFINIDAFRTTATDFTCEINDLAKYIKPNTIELIYSCHVLEHFSIKDSIEILEMFYNFLKPKGELRISVPDLIKLTNIIKRRELYLKDLETIQSIIMGGQNTRYNYHKSVYWFDLLKENLIKTGFKDISKYPSYPHFLGEVKDTSLLSFIGKSNVKTYISLNVKAIK